MRWGQALCRLVKYHSKRTGNENYLHALCHQVDLSMSSLVPRSTQQVSSYKCAHWLYSFILSICVCVMLNVYIDFHWPFSYCIVQKNSINMVPYQPIKIYNSLCLKRLPMICN